MESHDIERAIEAILFVSGEPVKQTRIAAVLGVDEFHIDAAANRLRDGYSFERRGIRLVKLEDSLQLCSSPDYADFIRRAIETRKPPQLSQPALEVLSIIAYFGPVTKAYVEQIRGVDSGYTVGLLHERGLVEPCGRLDVPGRPILYKTNHNFLRTFGMQSLKDLPELPQIEGSGDEKEGIQTAILELQAREVMMESQMAIEAVTQSDTQIENQTEFNFESEGEQQEFPQPDSSQSETDAETESAHETIDALTE